MIDLNAQSVWLAPGVTDMRKSIDGLAALVKHGMGREPTEASIFVFCGRRRDRIKLLYWDINGFWLLYKRLEGGQFRWPAPGAEAMLIDRRQLAWLLDGLQIEQRQANRRVSATIVA